MLTGSSDPPAGLEAEAWEALRVLPAARLGALLAARRREAKVRTHAAASAAHIEVGALAEIEGGRTSPGVGVLAALLECYQVAPGEFLPRRTPLAVAPPVLGAFVDQVREWRGAGAKERLTFRQGDVAVLAELLGSDPAEIERRLIALTGCSRAEARRLRKWLLAAAIVLPVAAPLVGGLTVSAQAAPHHASSATARRHDTRAAARTLIWHDEFSGPAGAAPDPTKWQAVSGGDGWGNSELEYYTSRTSNVALDGQGHLAITARQETFTDATGVTRNYTSARIQTKGLFQSTYGTIEARIKLPAGQGLWPAFWALGAGGPWPTAGEIDVMENIGSDPFTIYGSIHGPQTGSPHGYGITATEHSPASLAAGFHVYGVDWSPGKIVFTLDGVAYATRTPSDLSASQGWVFDRPFYLLLNVAVGGTWPGSPTASSKFPATMLVDWVRVYS